MDQRLLTPAEAALLLVPAGGTADKCVKAGLVALLAAGRVSIEPADGAANPAALALARHAPAAGEVVPAHLAALEQALRGYGKGERLTGARIVQALQRRFGYTYRRYVHEEVAPGLVRRGLLTCEDGKWLGLVPRIRYRRTARGEALIAPIARLMAELDRLPRLIDGDPEQAVRLARAAGVLLVLSPRARRQIPKLRALLAQGGDTGPALIVLPGEEEGEEEWEVALEFGDLALDMELGALFDGVDAVGDLTDGSSDGGSSDGGDGGGGD